MSGASTMKHHKELHERIAELEVELAQKAEVPKDLVFDTREFILRNAEGMKQFRTRLVAELRGEDRG